MKSSAAALASLLEIDGGDGRLIYVDCGARKGKLPPQFRGFRHAVYVGVEADGQECARLNGSARPRHRYIEAVLGRTSEPRTFRITRSPACASLLEPNHDFLGQFLGLGDGFHVERTIMVETVSLDACLERHNVPRADFVELDVQGSELEVLMGAKRTLETALGIQAEVEFAPMYVGQPLFGDVDAFLRTRGFHLFDLSRYHARRAVLDAGALTRGQLLWGHAQYLRDHRTLDPRMSARLAVLAALLDLPDLAADILARLSASVSSSEHHRAVVGAQDALALMTGGTSLTRLIRRLQTMTQVRRWRARSGPGAPTPASRHRSVWCD